LAQWFCRRRFFLKCQCIFTLLPLEKGYLIHLKILESPLPKDDLCQIWLKLAKWFCRRFLKIAIVFLLFHYYLPLGKGYSLHLNKLKSPLHKDDLCQIWLKLAKWFWRRRFIKIVIVFLLFCYYLPLEKG
jgi:hypothetical protein